MSNDALILNLSASLVPVRRRSMARETALLLALCAMELVLLLGLGLMRPDMGQMIGSTYMLWKLGSLALLAGISCVVAIRSFSPVMSPRRGLMIALALAGIAMSAGVLLDPADGNGLSVLDRLSPVHGLLCATSIVILSLPIMAMLALLMQRGASTHPEGSALASGLAAGTCGALIFAFCCPINDPLYVIVWYFAGCATVVAAARWLLPGRFRL
jgi:hypothetical protein